MLGGRTQIWNQSRSLARAFSEQPIWGARPGAKLENQGIPYALEYEKVPGRADQSGTNLYAEKTRIDIPTTRIFKSPFCLPDVKVSRLGVGTYIGDPTEEHDKLVVNSILDVVTSGIVNSIDTASNYRYMKAERSVGAALQILRTKHNITRDQLFISTKAGYLTKDADRPGFSETQLTNLLKDGKMTPEDIVGNSHCMHPAFLQTQLDQSLKNLGVQTLDIFYLHNPAESQLALIGENLFLQRLRAAFEWLELQRLLGKLKHYGIASWNCFRSPITEEGVHLSLERTVRIAEEVGGLNHGFRFIQLPINLSMTESFSNQWQGLDSELYLEDNEKISKKLGISPKQLPQPLPDTVSPASLVRVARVHKINIVGSSSLLQGKVLGVRLDPKLLKCESNAARHLLLLRSIPDESILTNLVGMKTLDHTLQNLQVARHDNLSPPEFMQAIRSLASGPKSAQ